MIKAWQNFYFWSNYLFKLSNLSIESQTCIKTKEHVLQCVTLSKTAPKAAENKRFKYHLQHRWSPSQPSSNPFIIKRDSPFFPRLLSIIFWSPTWSRSLRMGLDLYSNRRFHSGCQKISWINPSDTIRPFAVMNQIQSLQCQNPKLSEAINL